MIALKNLSKLAKILCSFIFLITIKATLSYCCDDIIETKKFVSSEIIYSYDLPDDLPSYQRLRVKNDPLWFFDKHQDIIINQHIKSNQPLFLRCRNLLITGSIKASFIQIEADNIVCCNNKKFRPMRKIKTNGRHAGDQVILDPFNNRALPFYQKLRYLSELDEDPGLLKAEKVKLYARQDIALLGNAVYGKLEVDIHAGNNLHIETGVEQRKFEKVIHQHTDGNPQQIDKTSVTK